MKNETKKAIPYLLAYHHVPAACLLEYCPVTSIEIHHVKAHGCSTWKKVGTINMRVDPENIDKHVPIEELSIYVYHPKYVTGQTKPRMSLHSNSVL